MPFHSVSISTTPLVLRISPPPGHPPFFLQLANIGYLSFPPWHQPHLLFMRASSPVNLVFFFNREGLTALLFFFQGVIWRSYLLPHLAPPPRPTGELPLYPLRRVFFHLCSLCDPPPSFFVVLAIFFLFPSCFFYVEGPVVLRSPPLSGKVRPRRLPISKFVLFNHPSSSGSKPFSVGMLNPPCNGSRALLLAWCCLQVMLLGRHRLTKRLPPSFVLSLVLQPFPSGGDPKCVSITPPHPTPPLSLSSVHTIRLGLVFCFDPHCPLSDFFFF